ncbi:MAG TPA: carboxypeptidase-like regulatory domain-containing protein [Gaiellaceae bacterium]|jgi:hypothetical protein
MLLATPGAGGTASGLRGLVTRGPTSPVCRVDQPCSAPAAHVKLTFVRAGRSWSVTTGADGRYRISLVPGRYAVRIAGARFGYSPTAATVPRGRVATVNFDVDTGIR